MVTLLFRILVVAIIFSPTVITFKNPLKVCTYNYNLDTPDTNCKSICLIEKPGFNGFLKIIGTKI